MSKISGVLAVLSVAACSTAANAQKAAGPKSVGEGAELARTLCAGCHAVAPNQPAEVVLKPPPRGFSDIANDPNSSAKALRRFITTTHWDERTFPMTMPNPMLLDDESDKVAAYIMSLRSPAAPPPPRPPVRLTAKDRRVDAGEELALRQCSLCHVVSSDRRYRPTLEQPTPSFAQIANDPKTTSKSLRRFITTTHWNEKTLPMTMPEQALDGGQTADVVSYILSLRKPGP